MTTPNERLIAGHAESAARDTKRLEFIAAAHRPEDDAEADRLAALNVELPLITRLSLGYQRSARDAAHTLTTKEKKA